MIPMKRERPPMPPLSVRVKVAERQFDTAFPNGRQVYDLLVPRWSLTRRLQWLLFSLFKVEHRKGGISVHYATGPHALDHNPALILRPYNPRIKDVAARYTPHAHDPDSLEYKRRGAHDEKTFGRKEGAAKTVTTKGSDIWVKTKFNRLEGRTKKKPKRAWPKGRKLRSRGFQQRRV